MDLDWKYASGRGRLGCLSIAPYMLGNRPLGGSNREAFRRCLEQGSVNSMPKGSAGFYFYRGKWYLLTRGKKLYETNCQWTPSPTGWSPDGLLCLPGGDLAKFRLVHPWQITLGVL